MNKKTTLTVLMIAVLIGAYFILFETDLVRKNLSDSSTPTTYSTSQSGQPLLTPEIIPAQVQQLTISLPGHQPFVIIRDTDTTSPGWKQISPFPYELTGWKIDALITNALKLHYTNRINPSDLAGYGLKSPQATFTIKTAQGEHTLKLGVVAPAGGAYLMLDNQTDIYIVDADLHRQLIGQTPADFRSVTLPNIPFGRVQNITLSRDDANIDIQRTSPETSTWFFSRGLTGRASGEAAESLTNAVNFASIEKFVADQPDDLTRFGLTKPRIVFTVTQSQPTLDAQSPASPVTHTLKIGSSTDLNDTSFYAMFDDAPVVFTLAKASIDRLTIPLNKLRDPRLTPASQADLRELLITRAADAVPVIHLAKTEGRWAFADPKPTYELELDSVDQLLKAIFNSTASDYIDMSKIAGSNDLVRIKLSLANASPDELTIYDHDAKTLVVRRNDESVGYIVDRPALAVALNDKPFYRDRTIVDLKPADIASIHVARIGRFPAEYDLKRAPAGQFDLAGFDHDAVQSFFKAITPLRAARWTPDTLEPKHYDQTITLTDNTGVAHTIQLNLAQSTGRYDSNLFTLNTPTIDALFAELRQRVVIPLDVNQFAVVAFDNTTVTRDDNGQITVDGKAIQSTQAGKLLDNLAGLHAEHFIPADIIKMDIAHPSHSLLITPRTGSPLTLHIWSAQTNDYHSVIGRVNDGPLFTLADDPLNLPTTTAPAPALRK